MIRTRNVSRRHTVQVERSNRPHLVQGEQERERRFGALVLIGPIDVQPVAATAGRRVEEPVLQVVLTEEPVERPPRLGQPPPVVADAVRVEARRHHRAGLDRLLVEHRRRRPRS